MRGRGGVKHFRNSRRIRRNVTPFVIPTAAQAEWRNPLRCKKELPQDKTCHSGRFIGSLRLLGMTCRGVVPVIRTGYNCHAAERHIGRSLRTLTDGHKWTTLVAPIIVNCPLPIVNSKITVNCQLSTVHSPAVLHVLTGRIRAWPWGKPAHRGNFHLLVLLKFS